MSYGPDMLKRVFNKFRSKPKLVYDLDERSVDLILARVFYRVSFILSKADMDKIVLSDKKDPEGKIVSKIILKKIPYFGDLIKEEVLNYIYNK